ncbi:glycosyltransferase family 1 protein [Pedobacter agri]|uniref:glycosyltransferase family 4 protein n=1 Tax=Pedobacter agri TaxID=454586 RepID=UPI0029305610|nr:glycosyltransferase family 1 protein [Pedobacter agri]
MRIGIDAQPFGKNPSGIGKYSIALVRYLFEAFPEATYYGYSNKDIYLPENLLSKFVIKKEESSLKRKLPDKVWLKLFAGQLIAKDNIDVYFSTTGFFPKLKKSVKRVTIVYDLNYKLVPEKMGKLHYYSHLLFLKSDTQSADFVISISQGTAKKTKKYFDKESHAIINPPIDAIYEPKDKIVVKEVLDKYNLNGKYLMTVGTIEPRKNLITTINVFIDLINHNKLNGYKLVLIGAGGWKNEGLIDLCNKYKNQILRLGYVSDEDLPYLYNGASLFLFPSIYEGFGIPVREALACGVPVVTSDIEELRESGGNSGVAYISPLDEMEYGHAILAHLEFKVKPIVFKKQEAEVGKFINFFKTQLK